MEVTVKHQSIGANWISPNKINNPKTLVLGSFNPFDTRSDSVDYYYGRKSNHFWKSIAIIINENEDFFFQSATNLERKKAIMNNRFCCLDVINSITIASPNNQIVNTYINNEIHKGFKDQKIWSGYTNYKKKDRIVFKREYNRNILDFLKENNSINKIIHTMGSNRIKESGVQPKEKKLKNNGFDGFFGEIKSICKQKQIKINFESWSPSDYAIRTGSTSMENLNKWLKLNLQL